MKIAICIFALTISGCGYQRVDSGDINSATKACVNHGGINSISAFWYGAESTTCNDGYSIAYLQFPKD